MIISNGEAFIKLDTAAKAYFNIDLMFDEVNTKHYKHLEKYLDLYVHINSICDVCKPAPPPIEYAFSTTPKNIKGMCKAELVNSPLSNATGANSTAKIKLTTSNYITNIPLELADCLIRPVDNYLSPDNYFRFAFVRIAELITHAKVIGIEINIFFLKPIIINDDSFRTLKEISNKDIDSEFNFKQAANKYFKHFNGVLEQTIIDACEYASNIYDHENKMNDTESMAKANINEIEKLINETVPTNEDIELFKSNLPDVWQEALSNSILPNNQSGSESSSQIKLPSLSNTITHKSEMLEALQGAIHEFWEGKADLDYANKRATNEVVSMWVTENYNFIDNTTALYIARIIRPEVYKRKK